mgnify:CR=1 FL=1
MLNIKCHDKHNNYIFNMNEAELVELGQSENSNLINKNEEEYKEENDICIICRNINDNTSKTINDICEHKFHNKCVDEILEKCDKCPVCRKPINKKNNTINEDIFKKYKFSVNIIIFVYTFIVLYYAKILTNPFVYTSNCDVSFNNCKSFYDCEYYQTRGTIVNNTITTKITDNDKVNFIIQNEFKYHDKYCKDIRTIKQDNKDNAIIIANNIIDTKYTLDVLKDSDKCASYDPHYSLDDIFGECMTIFFVSIGFIIIHFLGTASILILVYEPDDPLIQKIFAMLTMNIIYYNILNTFLEEINCVT